MTEAGHLLLALGTNPWAIAAAIVLATFVLEDVATIAAAVLAADAAINPWLALGALVSGIFVGDLVLYGLGAYARTHDWAKRLIGEKRMDKGRAWLKRRYVPALIGARFMPGLRLPTYTSSGFLNLPFAPFAAVAAAAGLAWTTTIFSLVYFLGAMTVEHLGLWRWSLAAVLLVCVLLAPYAVQRFVPAGSDTTHG
jgi:membrane protein DedA with SNARE-associated domain